MRTMPPIICLCGSTRFKSEFAAANLRETLAGNIVLSIGCDTKSDAEMIAAGELTPEIKARLDELHKRKIDLADEVLILNVGGYVGDSTFSEIVYALRKLKFLRWIEQPDEGLFQRVAAHQAEAMVLMNHALASQADN